METHKSEFEQLNGGRSSILVVEFLQFALENKKWWMLPIVAVLMMLTMLMMFAGSGAAPFIYTLF